MSVVPMARFESMVEWGRRMGISGVVVGVGGCTWLGSIVVVLVAQAMGEGTAGVKIDGGVWDIQGRVIHS